MFSKNFWFIVSANLLMALKKTLKKQKAVIQINECNPWQSIPTVCDSGGSTFGTEHTCGHSRGQSVQWHWIYRVTPKNNYTLVKKFLHLCWKSQTIEFCFPCCTLCCIPEKTEQFFQIQCHLLPNPDHSQGWHHILSGFDSFCTHIISEELPLQRY